MLFQVRRKERIEWVLKLLVENNFISKAFYNNTGPLSFNNILAVRKSSQVNSRSYLFSVVVH